MVCVVCYFFSVFGRQHLHVRGCKVVVHICAGYGVCASCSQAVAGQVQLVFMVVRAWLVACVYVGRLVSVARLMS